MKRRSNVRAMQGIVICAMIACWMGTGCQKPSASPTGSTSSNPPSSAGSAQGEGDEAEGLLADQAATAEAKAWLAVDAAQHHLWKASRPEVAKLVDDLYAAGATRVTMAGISRDGAVERSALIVVSLPDAADARAKILETHNEYWRQALGSDEPEDLEDFWAAEEGQKHLVVNFDL